MPASLCRWSRQGTLVDADTTCMSCAYCQAPSQALVHLELLWEAETRDRIAFKARLQGLPQETAHAKRHGRQRMQSGSMAAGSKSASITQVCSLTDRPVQVIRRLETAADSAGQQAHQHTTGLRCSTGLCRSGTAPASPEGGTGWLYCTATQLDKFCHAEAKFWPRCGSSDRCLFRHMFFNRA